jgi:lantibiotic modifying enzyme
LFLALLASHGGGGRCAELARGALRYAEAVTDWLLTSRHSATVAAFGHDGVFSTVYAQAECARLLGDEELLRGAVRRAGRLLPALRRSPFKPDVINGASGGVLMLLHLNRLTPDDRLLRQAEALGEAIIAAQEPGEGPRGWRAPSGGEALLGMGHGAAGMAYALAQLAAAVGRDDFRAAAAAGLAFERTRFDAERQDWPTGRLGSDGPTFMDGWCAGPAGAGLARLGMRGLLPGYPNLDAEIELAVAATRRHVGTGLHHLCCGESGRVLFLLEAGRALDRPELERAAWDAAGAMLDQYEAQGCWRLQEFAERSIQPGLMGGVAGVGLTLLSLLEPQRAPRVLLLA